MSPTGKYTANAFYEPYGGASSASGVNVWIEITNNEEQTSKTIYYADAKRNILMKWIDEETISIVNKGNTKNSDRSIKLNVEKEIYHENGLACQSLLLKNDYETCYQDDSSV